jgi:hypothetical protein
MDTHLAKPISVDRITNMLQEQFARLRTTQQSPP